MSRFVCGCCKTSEGTPAENNVTPKCIDNGRNLEEIENPAVTPLPLSRLAPLQPVVVIKKQPEQNKNSGKQHVVTSLFPRQDNISSTTGRVEQSERSVHVHKTYVKNVFNAEHLETSIHNPRAKAFVFGNDNRISSEEIDKETMRKKRVEYIERHGGNRYIRNSLNEINQRLFAFEAQLQSMNAQIKKTHERDSESVKKTTEKMTRQGPPLLGRSKSFWKSKSFKTNSKTHALLQQTEWEQYEKLQREMLSVATCEIYKCQSVEELEIAWPKIKLKLQKMIDEITDKSETMYVRSSASRRKSEYDDNTDQWRRNVIKSLHDNKERVMKQANLQLVKVKLARMESLKRTSEEKNERVSIDKSHKQKAYDAAEKLISILTEKITQYVSTLLPLKIQQNIIVFKFSCQKSFVIKEMMKDFIENDCFFDSLRYILHPNDFAKIWLENFTNENIFRKKSGKHLFAKFAEAEIDEIMKMIKRVTTELKNKDNICSWVECFLNRVQESNLLPLSKDELIDVHKESELDIKSFLSIFSHRLENIQYGINQVFNCTTEINVQWTENPHDKIMENLWGCTHCCPFCHEPCHFSDISHIAHGQKHRCIQHRPLGVYGFMNETNNDLVTEWCNILIQTDDQGYKFTDDESLRPCKNYQEEFTDWKIETTESSCSDPHYWIWFINKYQEQLKDFYVAEIPLFPDTWKNVTEKDALKSLKNVYICS